MATPASSLGFLKAASDGIADLVERTGRRVVAVHARRRFPSSGILWSEGIVVTAAHTVVRDSGVTVVLPDGQPVSATLIGRDPGTDIAALRVTATGAAPPLDGARIDGAAPPWDAADANGVRPGHLAFAVGRYGGAHTVLDYGLVATVGPAWRTWRGAELDAFIRLDGALRPGFSGAALVDAEGRLLGMGTSGLARGAGVVIPMSNIGRVVAQLVAHGRVARGYLGLALQPVELPDRVAEDLELKGARGLLIAAVEKGGPGESAGLYVGDILISLDGRPCARAEDALVALGSMVAGKTVAVGAIRGGQPVEVTLTLGERPQRRRCA
ncbi:MAG TPA: trypsin-like peptidase domain-containing protein [Steroidobacteraceae bacterium]|jgi:S1-C subfamily serine protease